MKTTGVSGIPKFGLLDFLGHPSMYTDTQTDTDAVTKTHTAIDT